MVKGENDMKAKTILEIRNLLFDKTSSSEEQYENERTRLEKIYKTDWLTNRCSKKELKNLHNLLAENDKWKEVLEEFENNEF